MYINRPLLKGEYKKQERASTDMNSKGEYLLDIIQQIEQIEQTWQKLTVSAEDEVQRARKFHIDTEDDEAFLRCSHMLQEQFDIEEQKFNKVRRKLKIGMQTVEEHIQICKGEKGQKLKEKQELEEGIKQIQIQISKVEKRKTKRSEYHDKIDEEAALLDNEKNRLQELTEKSYTQKDLYSQVHEIERGLLEQIGKVEEEEKIYYEFKSREERYRQLSKVLEKLRDKRDYSSKDNEVYLKERINMMALLRTNLISFEQSLQSLDNAIEEQNYIVEGLRLKATTETNTDNLFRKYHDRYEQLYFAGEDNIENWKDYKGYLEELLKRSKIQPLLTRHRPATIHYAPDNRAHQDNQRYASLYRHRPNLRTEPSFIDIQQGQPIDYNGYRDLVTPKAARNYLRRATTRQPQSVKLPKLVRMNGDREDQLKIKQNLKLNLKKMMDESDISLQSVRSDDSGRGEVIEVEFHKQ